MIKNLRYLKVRSSTLATSLARTADSTSIASSVTDSTAPPDPTVVDATLPAVKNTCAPTCANGYLFICEYFSMSSEKSMKFNRQTFKGVVFPSDISKK